jgi:hypothetical protein
MWGTRQKEMPMLFGSGPIDAHDLVQLLAAEVQPKAATLMGLGPNEIPRTQAQRDKCTEWTSAVKHVLSERGEQSGYHVHCSGRATSHELMLDVLWCFGSSACAGIALACESEWNYADEVSRDFQKLLVVKAPLKLLIYSGREPMGGQIRARVKQDMELYPHHAAGEEYVFVGLDWDIRYAHRYVVPGDGRQSDVTLKPLELAAGSGLISAGSRGNS